jgi:hypothetical protein
MQYLLPEIKVTIMRQFSRIIMAMLGMSRQLTMLGISRWSVIGGSYRTVMRFFYTVLGTTVLSKWLGRLTCR